MAGHLNEATAHLEAAAAALEQLGDTKSLTRIYVNLGQMNWKNRSDMASGDWPWREQREHWPSACAACSYFRTETVNVRLHQTGCPSPWMRGRIRQK